MYTWHRYAVTIFTSLILQWSDENWYLQSDMDVGHLENFLYCLIQFLVCIVLYSFIMCFVLYSLLCALFYTVSCVLETTVNHAIPCLSITRKSSGPFFIMHLILILSLSLIVTILDKLILLSLKGTLTSFQSISKVSQI